MAPTQPSKRPSLRARPSRPTRPTPSSTTTTPTPRTKKAKQHTRRTTFLSRITKPAPTPATTRTRRRRRAPPTQLALDSLASALDDAAATTQPKPAGSGVGSNTIRSRPGAMKRKERVVRSECERFGKNLAIMAAGVAATAVAAEGEGEGERGAVRGPSTWEALRGFIEGTMERKEEFVKKAEEGEEMVL